MITFTYEEDGITVTMETDAHGLYEDYSHGDGLLGHFLRFLRAAGYSFEIEETLQVMDPNKEVIIDQSELRRRTDGYHVQWSDEDGAWVAESSGVTAYSDEGPVDALALLRGPEKSNPIGQWIEWHGGDQPVSDDTKVEVQFGDGSHDADIASGFCWEEWNQFADIVAYRVISESQTVHEGSHVGPDRDTKTDMDMCQEDV